MEVKSEREIKGLMEDFYGSDRAKSSKAQKALLEYGEELINADQLEDYQSLVVQCGGIIADKGVDVNPVMRLAGGVEASLPAEPEVLMQEFEKQANEKLGEKTEHAETVRKVREMIHKSTVLAEKRRITGKIERLGPASVEGFLEAIDRNNAKSEEAQKVSEKRLEHFKGYFPDTDAVTTINPNADTYKDSQYDRVDRLDRQAQLLEDLKKTYEELAKNEENRRQFQEQVNDGEEDAKANVEACKKKEKELREKIAKTSPDGRQTGIIQRLQDLGMSSADISALDFEAMESYEKKLEKLETVNKHLQEDRDSAYKDMAKTVVETLKEKGVVDPNSKRYPASKKDELVTTFNRIINGEAGKGKTEGFEEGADGETNREEYYKQLKEYVKYVKDDIVLTTEKISETKSVIEERNQTKADIERDREETKRAAEEAKARAEKLKSEPVSDEQKEAWLSGTKRIRIGDEEREITEKEDIKNRATVEAEGKYANRGRNPLSRALRGVGFFFRHGFKSRNKMIAQEAESLTEQRTNEFVANKKNQAIAEAEEAARHTETRFAREIEQASREGRNDASVHEAAYKRGVNITESYIAGKSEYSKDDVARAEDVAAQNLSDMGYDLALQKWRNNQISQEDFDRVLREHLSTTREQRDAYADPDESKGYTHTPEFRNKARTEEPPVPTPTPDEEHDGPAPTPTPDGGHDGPAPTPTPDERGDR